MTAAYVIAALAIAAAPAVIISVTMRANRRRVAPTQEQPR